MKTLGLIVVASSPVLVSFLGVEFPALSMLMAMIAVVVVRIMMMAKDPPTLGFWYYHISLMLLMLLITFGVIADAKTGPGTSVMIGSGIGASGVVIVDILKERVQRMIKSFFGNDSDPS